jgi:hypothetical protein
MTINLPRPEGWTPPPKPLPPETFHGLGGKDFIPFTRRGYTCIKVLPFLNGKSWNWVAMGYVHSLRPSRLRVTKDSIHLDSCTWRVTVWLEEDNHTIREIEQEVEVGLPEGVPHGAGLQTALKHGMDSEQLKWDNIHGMTAYLKEGIFKYGEDGKTYPYPTP